MERNHVPQPLRIVGLPFPDHLYQEDWQWSTSRSSCPTASRWWILRALESHGPQSFWPQWLVLWKKILPGTRVGNSLGMIQAHDIYCTLNLYYYYIGSTSDPWIKKIFLEKEIATHSSILAWEITWKEEPSGLQSMGCKESDTTQGLNNNSIQPGTAVFNPHCS